MKMLGRFYLVTFLFLSANVIQSNCAGDNPVNALLQSGSSTLQQLLSGSSSTREAFNQYGVGVPSDSRIPRRGFPAGNSDIQRIQNAQNYAAGAAGQRSGIGNQFSGTSQAFSQRSPFESSLQNAMSNLYNQGGYSQNPSNLNSQLSQFAQSFGQSGQSSSGQGFPYFPGQGGSSFGPLGNLNFGQQAAGQSLGSMNPGNVAYPDNTLGILGQTPQGFLNNLNLNSPSLQRIRNNPQGFFGSSLSSLGNFGGANPLAGMLGSVNPQAVGSGALNGLGVSSGDQCNVAECDKSFEQMQQDFQRNVIGGQFLAGPIFERFRQCKQKADRNFFEQLQDQFSIQTLMSKGFDMGSINVAVQKACLQGLKAEERKCKNLQCIMCKFLSPKCGTAQAMNQPHCVNESVEFATLIKLFQEIGSTGEAERTCQGLQGTVSNPNNFANFLQGRANAGVLGGAIGGISSLFPGAR